MCCVVLAWESHCSWPTWPGNLAHPLSVPLSDFCRPGFWGKICRCLCPLDIPWNAKFLGTLKAGSLKCQWKAELLNHYFPWEQILLYEVFQEHPEAMPQSTMQCAAEITLLLVVWGQICLFPPKWWISGRTAVHRVAHGSAAVHCRVPKDLWGQ